MPVDLFDVVRKDKALDLNFEKVYKEPVRAAGRTLINKIYESYYDKDGTFIRQFQEHNFDARLFELYVYEYLKSAKFTIKDGFTAPDFLVEKDNIEVAIEVTTINPPSEGRQSIMDMSPEEVQFQEEHGKACKFSNSLRAKMAKKYWEKEHCTNKPFVIAIQDFQQDQSQIFTDKPLSNFLYGLDDVVNYDENGNLDTLHKQIAGHKIIGKDVEVDSGFFNDLDNENLSAVIFTNSGTWAKFTRMAIKFGWAPNITGQRIGYKFDPTPNATSPLVFSEYLDPPIQNERWGEGLVVMENPNAKHPLPRDYFPYALRTYMQDGKRLSDVPPNFIYSSTSIINETESLYLEDGTFLKKISLDAYKQIYRFPGLEMGVFNELEHYYHLQKQLVCFIAQDQTDNDYLYMILGNTVEDPMFRCVGIQSDIESLPEARSALQEAVLNYEN
ncbi:hypothetical protein LNTAR_15082 [Lentisphaera araneosa HTCC2155]|uniref:Uncharacterized protein n=1 Tax=Lentisphaera araneosa HTCC2155 TaxID=313628 RepID=A6DRE1_9BACT|nr:hypothetical protein [Lentisphaera araneosa]EDM25751.1 hypothetical protein LNTAR_15082 [Lentisphaera araneosa HTCC2155]